MPSNLVADFAAGGMNSAIGILAALIAREKTGRGQYVDIGLADGVVTGADRVVAIGEPGDKELKTARDMGARVAELTHRLFGRG